MEYSEFNSSRLSFREFANMAKLPCTKILVHNQYNVPRGEMVTFLVITGMSKRYNLFLGCIAQCAVENLLRFFAGSKDGAALGEAEYWLPKKEASVGGFRDTIKRHNLAIPEGWRWNNDVLQNRKYYPEMGASTPTKGQLVCLPKEIGDWWIKASSLYWEDYHKAEELNKKYAAEREQWLLEF